MAAMRSGAAIISQGVWLDGRWGGRAGIPSRVDTPSSLGDWSYEVIDTKLARETKGGSVLQFCLYTDGTDTHTDTEAEFCHVHGISPGSLSYRRSKRGVAGIVRIEVPVLAPGWGVEYDFGDCMVLRFRRRRTEFAVVLSCRSRRLRLTVWSVSR